MKGPQVRAWLLRAYIAAIAVFVLGASLRPGYTLSYDMVFTPRETLLPWTLGLGGGLPRSVPQDAVLSILTTVIPGWILQKVALLGALMLAGVGASRLVRGPGQWVAASLAIWNPFVAERLLIGHWSLLIAYACVPWALAAARDRKWPSFVLWCALAAVTPSGGLLLAVLGIPTVLILANGARSRALWSLAIAAVNLPWILPALLHGHLDASGTDAFALRSEGPGGALLTAISTGGIWNADVVLGSRATWVAPVFALVVVAAAVLGWRPTSHRLGRAALVVWTTVTGAALAVAMMSVLMPLAFAWLTGVPGGGLLRDAQKLLAPMAMLLAVLAGAGVSAMTSRIRDRALSVVVIVAATVAPLATMPDLAWGALGRLQSVDYPADFERVRELTAGSTGDVVSLPWGAFRDFGWNDRRTSLDPLPRFLTQTVLADDTLRVRRGQTVVPVGGEDPRAGEVAARLEAGEALADFAPGLGVEFAVVAHGVTGQVPPTALSGATEISAGPDLSLYRLGDPVPPGPPAGLWLVGGVDALVGLGLLGLVAIWSLKRFKRRTGVLRSVHSDREEES